MSILGNDEVASFRSGTIRTVMVDDSDDVRFLMGIQLDLDGRFEVVAEAADARMGLYHAQQVRPDLVIVDLRMVGLDGIWLLGRLRRSLGPRVTLAVVTAHTEDEQRREAVGAGADIVIGKETMTTTLVDQLHGAVTGRSLVGAGMGSDRPATYLA